MGKDDKEDTGFGFKDRAKAEETLKLLEQHDMNYRRLTVRGLLGRAKRVLTLTKAEEKIKNIKEAMEVFESWLAELDKNKEKKPEPQKRAKKEEKKKSSSDKESGSSSSEEEKASLPSESVPGLGFKDAATAEESLQVLAGRDPDYQLLAVKGLVGRAKRVLTCTRDEAKLSNIKAAMSIFEKFIDEFDNLHLSRQNNPYLSAGIVRTAHKLAGDAVTELQRTFLTSYTAVHGEYKRLRNVTAEGGKTWDIVRNNELKELKEKNANAKLFNEKDEPTPEHLELLVWGYSPEAARVKKVVRETKEERKHQDGAEKNDRKRRSSAKSGDESDSKKKKE